MAQYAADTSVSVEKSKAELERILTRWGATAFMAGWQGERAAVGFTLDGRQIRFELPLPARGDRGITHTATGQKRSQGAAEKAHEQACRSRWRALVLAVKAKLAAIDAGISTVENEFLPWVVLPDGRTVGEHTRPAIAHAYETGQVSPLLALGQGKA